MTYIVIGVCLFMLLFNYGIYLRHTKKMGGSSSERGTYAMSWPTRLHKYLKDPFYLAVLLHIFVQPLVFNTAPPELPVLIAAVTIGVMGTVLLALSLRCLGANFKPCYSGILPVERVKSGPYRFVKHPIYLSNVLQFVALMLLIPGPIVYAVFVVMLWIYAYTIRDENRSLDAHFSSQNSSGSSTSQGA